MTEQIHQLPKPYHDAVLHWQRHNFPDYPLLLHWERYFPKDEPFCLCAKLEPGGAAAIEVGERRGQPKDQPQDERALAAFNLEYDSFVDNEESA